MMFAKENMVGELMLPKVKLADVVRQVLGAIEAGRNKVLVDDVSRAVKPRLGMLPDLGQVSRSATSTLLSGGVP